MSRVINFRGWDGVKMHDLYYVTPRGVGALGDGGMIIPRDGSPGAIMQFTGLIDANGVEIYEGDILQDSNLTDNAYSSGVYSRGEVVFHDSAFMQRYTHDDGKKYHERINERDVIVGNIYQNHELIKGDL